MVSPVTKETSVYYYNYYNYYLRVGTVLLIVIALFCFLIASSNIYHFQNLSHHIVLQILILWLFS